MQRRVYQRRPTKNRHYVDMNKKNRRILHIKVKEDDYTWRIEKFSTHCDCSRLGYSLHSNWFVTGDNEKYSWELELYPNGVSRECSNYISLCLHLNTCAENLFMRQLYVKMCLVNNNFEEVHESRYLHNSVQKLEDSVCLFDKFIKRDYVLDTNNGLLHNNQLLVRCKLFVYEGLDEYHEPASIDSVSKMLYPTPHPQLDPNPEQTGWFTDVSLRLGDQNLRVRLLGC